MNPTLGFQAGGNCAPGVPVRPPRISKPARGSERGGSGAHLPVRPGDGFPCGSGGLFSGALASGVRSPRRVPAKRTQCRVGQPPSWFLPSVTCSSVATKAMRIGWPWASRSPDYLEEHQRHASRRPHRLQPGRLPAPYRPGFAPLRFSDFVPRPEPVGAGTPPPGDILPDLAARAYPLVDRHSSGEMQVSEASTVDHLGNAKRKRSGNTPRRSEAEPPLTCISHHFFHREAGVLKRSQHAGSEQNRARVDGGNWATECRCTREDSEAL